ncbi:MAG: ImmA/IrrE family metallo-endopeptidase [Bacteroidaceae bacterium]|nr:ImmA/IrrE family metallo-endopeptidase [Bacteroidaceae bacterium]
MKMGIVKPKLSRLKFAQLVICICPELNIPAKTLKYSMDKYEPWWYDAGKERWNTENGNAIEGMLRGHDAAKQTQPQITPIDWLEQEIRKEREGYKGLWKIVRNKAYSAANGGIDQVQPTLALEEYSNQKFYQENRPSNVKAFVFVDKSCSRYDIITLKGLYNEFGGFIKLFVVSSTGFNADAYQYALHHWITLVRINPDGGITYLNPRTSSSYAILQEADKTFCGETMNGQIIIRESGQLYTLRDIISVGRSEDEKKIDVPFISDEKIEEIVLKLNLPFTMGEGTNGIEGLAELHGISISEEPMEEDVLGVFDIPNCHIRINSRTGNKHRKRFTLAHELGHYFLHYTLLRDNEQILKETASTVGSGSRRGNLHRMEIQANKFASMLLMPKKEVLLLANKIFTERERRMGYIYIDDQKGNQDRSQRVLTHMSGRFNVSKAAIKFRMIDLGFLKEKSTHL